jgi:hypothetical protein
MPKVIGLQPAVGVGQVMQPVGIDARRRDLRAANSDASV